MPLTRAQAQALAIDLSRRSTPAEGGFCTFQPVVDGGACPWNLDCHNWPTARAIDGLEKALAGLGLLDEALALDLRKPQDYFHRIWATAFRAGDLAAAGAEDPDTDEKQETG